MFSKLMQFIRQVIFRMIPYKNVEQAARIESPLSADMTTALDLWHDLYRDRAPWLKSDTVKSLNLPAFICGEIARQMILELKWDITGPANEDGTLAESPRAAFLKEEFAKLFPDLRGKLEQGCGAGGLTIKPYPKGKHFGYDWTTAWEFYPVSFGDEGNLHDVIFQEGYYATLKDIPDCYKPAVNGLMTAGVLKGYDGGKDGLVATIGDNTIRVDEMFCRVVTMLSRPGALAVLQELAATTANAVTTSAPAEEGGGV